MSNIPFEASCHLLHKFSLMFEDAAFAQIYDLHEYAEERFLLFKLQPQIT